MGNKKIFSSLRITKLLGLLLVTLLFVTSNIFTLNGYAYEKGNKYEVKFDAGMGSSYSIIGEYDGSSWKITETKNNISVNGDSIPGPSLLDVLGNAYALSDKTDAIGDLIKTVFDMIAKNFNGGTNVITGKIYDLELNHRTSQKEAKSETLDMITNKVWKTKTNSKNKQDSKSNFDPVKNLKSKTGTFNFFCACDDDGNPLKTVNAMKEFTISGGGKSGNLVSLMTDDVLFNYALASANNNKIIVKDITEGEGPGTIGVGVSYSMRLDIYDTETDVVVINKDTGKEVVTFHFADMVGEDSYKEKKYNNTSLSSVKLQYKSSKYYISAEDKPSSTADSKSMYYLISGSDRKTADIYADRLKKCTKSSKETFTEPIFILMKDAQGDNLTLYVCNEASKKVGELKYECGLSLDDFKAKYTERGTMITTGDWNFEVYQGSTIVAYKKGEKEVLKNGLFYDLGTLKRMHVKGDKYADLFVAVKKGVDSTFTYAFPQQTNRIFMIIRSNGDFNKKGNLTTLSEIKKEFLDRVTSDTYQILGVTASLKIADGAGAGSSKDNKLEPSSQILIDGSEPSGEDYPPEIPLNELILLIPKYRDMIENPSSSIDVDIAADLGDSKVEIKKDFLKDVIKYSKILLMIAIFASILYTAIVSILSSTDVKSRVEVKQRLENILKGTVIFACIVPIYNLILGFATNAYSSLADIADSYTGPVFYATVTRYKTGWVVNFIGGIVDIVAGLLKILTDIILANSLSPGTSLSLTKLVFDTIDPVTNKVSSYTPFTQNEWMVFMAGYKLLTAAAICIIAIAIVKLSIDALLGAGNYEKMTEVKESVKRTIFAVLGIVLAPYGFRLILLLCNYLTAMLPVDPETVTFDIDFKAAGLVGSVANFTFVAVRLRIFIAFLVRKVMLVVMLLASPIVLAMWAVDKKFRGMSMWIGETVSNMAIQFCYAMVFLVLILITYEGQNPFITLIVVSLIPKLANFFSKSLQGFAQRWGSINAEGVSDEVIGFMKKGGDKVIGGIKRTGKTLQKGARLFDKDGISKSGKMVNNVGALMSGDLFSMRTKREMWSNRERASRQFLNEERQKLKDRENEFAPYESDKEISGYLKDIEKAYEDYGYVPSSMIRSGTGFDQANALAEQRQNTKLASLRQEGMHKLTDTYQNDDPILGGLIRRLDDADKDNAVRKTARYALKFAAMGPVSSIQRLFDTGGIGQGLDKIQKVTEKTLFDDVNDMSELNISDLIDQITKMQNQINQYRSGSADIKKQFKHDSKLSGQNVMNEVMSYLKNDTAPSREKAEIMQEVITIATQYDAINNMDHSSSVFSEEGDSKRKKKGGLLNIENALRAQAVLDEYNSNIIKKENEDIINYQTVSNQSMIDNNPLEFLHNQSKDTDPALKSKAGAKLDELPAAQTDTEMGAGALDENANYKPQMRTSVINEANLNGDQISDVKIKQKEKLIHEKVEKLKKAMEEQEQKEKELKELEEKRKELQLKSQTQEEKKELKKVNDKISVCKTQKEQAAKNEKKLKAEIDKMSPLGVSSEDYIKQMKGDSEFVSVDERHLDNFKAKSVVETNVSQIHKTGKKH